MTLDPNKGLLTEKYDDVIEELKQKLENQKEELSSGAATDSTAGDTVSSCEMPHEEDNTTNKEDEKKNKQCDIGGINVTIGKESKVIAKSEPIPLEIVAGYKKSVKEIKCVTNGLNGPCSQHDGKIYDPNFDPESKSNSDLTFKAKSKPFYKVFHNKTIFPWKAKTNEYYIHLTHVGIV